MGGAPYARRVDVGHDDPRLDDYRELTAAGRRQRVEAERGIFVAEGVLAIRALLRSQYPVRSVLATSERAAVLGEVDAPVYVASLDTLRAVTGFDLHRGAVAIGERLPLPDPAEILTAARRVAVLEGINDHENLGSIFRSAAAFGIDAVLLDATCADPLYRRAVRVSLGHVLHVPFTCVAQATEVARHGYTVVALTPSDDAEPIDALAADAPDRLALVLGAEGPGLRSATLHAAHRRVRIPMSESVDSLNVAVAAAIAFHRTFRPSTP
jgi:tRNA G18 (ribose-2'-O)-methylase SpoU